MHGRKGTIMHWFGRAAMTVVVASILGICVGLLAYWAVETLELGWFWRESAYTANTPGMIMAGSAAIFSLWIHRYVTGRFGSPPDAETRCRKCRYILKGITEPRCPECGERI